MSRWRQMLLDYGQDLMGSSRKSVKSSTIYSLDGDLEATRRDAMQLRRDLEMNFRPLFQRFVYGGEKIACHDLKRILREPNFRSLLPPDKVHELIDVCDMNQGRTMSYQQFVTIVTGTENDDTSFGSEHGFTGDEDEKPGLLMTVCRNTQPVLEMEERIRTYRCLPPPFFMVAVTLAQIVIYIVYAVGDDVRETGPLRGLPVESPLLYNSTRRHEAWRFVTYCFLHQGYVDLVLTVLLQLVLGVPLEIVFSFWRLAIVYFCGVITGSLGHSVADRYSDLAGGAGGAYAVVAAHVVSMIHNWSQLNDRVDESKVRRILCSVSLRLVLIVVVVAPQVALAVYRRFFYDDVFITVGIGPYVGGIVAGTLLGTAFMKDVNRYPWQAGAGYMNLFTFLIFVGACVIFNIAFDDYPDDSYS